MMVAGSILQADPVVQAVILILLMGSVASWAIIIQKLLTLGRLGQEIRYIEAFARGVPEAGARPRLLGLLLAARDTEAAATSADLRLLRAAAIRGAYLSDLRHAEGGLAFLATLASTAPFIGLFGTVWGIMRSFSAIAASNDTGLSVVAPGIAEALLATAIGLAAAIPAVVAFNLIRAALRRGSHRLAAVTGLLARVPPATGPGQG